MALDPLISPAASLATVTTMFAAPAMSTVCLVDSRFDEGGTRYAAAWSGGRGSASYTASVSWLTRSHE